MRLLAHPDQPLTDHLKQVAEKAASFAAAFSGAEHACLAGLLHDLGKTEDEFQKRVREETGKKEPHAHHGAVLALERGPIWPVALAVNGHHAGLHNRGDVDKRREEYALKAEEAVKRLAEDATRNGQEWPALSFEPPLPAWLRDLPFDTRMSGEGWLAVELYTRFLFSALIDADRLDTEEHAEELKGLPPGMKRRQWNAFSADVLLGKLNEHIQEVSRDNGSKTSRAVAEVRGDVAKHCRQAAAKPKGVFALSVPTGGGKTLASMLFALEHARKHRSIRRVIVVIPYLSIIQQTAREFQKAFGEKWVLEHHSQTADPASEKKPLSDGARGYDREKTLRQLAAENWDAPIIVTTSVQFFDSLFSRWPSDARKLHNIAQSVVIFDECQTFPPRLMQPILNALGELANHSRPYGCSLVFCTATQPALGKSEDLSCGLENVEPIIPHEDEVRHFQVLRRTTYPELEGDDDVPTLTWEQIADALVSAPHQQGLVVVNTRRHARELFKAVLDKAKDTVNLRQAVFHLSTWMTPAHRSEVLDEVKRRLQPEAKEPKEPCLLISTQCIEAGVDVDFPAVWRAFGPYDAIVQTAGRCNRNGNFPDAQVHIFRPEKESLPQGIYDTATKQTELLRKQRQANPHDPGSFAAYFRLLYQLSVPDECEIQKNRGQLHFEEVSKLFRFIEDNTLPVLVLYGVANSRHFDTESRVRYEEAGKRKLKFFLAEDWRTFQKDIVSLPRYNMDALIRAKLIQDSFLGDRNLFVLQGDAAYRGGLNDFGIDFRPDYAERSIL